MGSKKLARNPRQGDVMLVPLHIPKGAKEVKVENDTVVLALGEATGHSHTLTAPGIKVYEHEGTRYIRVPKGGPELAHQEHGNIAVAEGDFQVVIQNEYTPEEIRKVRD